MLVKLYAPLSYWQGLKDGKTKKICNGCGAKKGIKFSPLFFGLNMTMCCDIHDWMYHEGKSNNDKEIADRVFLNNMLRVIEAKPSNSFIKSLRKSRAKSYYIAVKLFGGNAFWDGKNLIENYREVRI